MDQGKYQGDSCRSCYYYPIFTWVGTSVYNGAVYKGELKAKQEIDETYNEALRDAIVYRAKYESCCSELQED